MAKQGTVRGDVVVGDSGAPEVAVALALATATVTKQQSGKTVVAAGSALVLSLSGSAVIQLLYVKIVNNSTKNAQACVMTITPGAIVMPASTEWLIIASTGATMTSVSIAVTGSDAEIEFVVAG